MKTRICPECGTTFEVKENGRGKPKLFCSEEHKQTHANRRASRGKSLVTIAQAWRRSRGSGEYGKFLFAELCSILDEFNEQDKKAGRIDPIEYHKLLSNFQTINPDYHGGKTFWADRWMDRLDANR